jgi:hypothetical protein
MFKIGWLLNGKNYDIGEASLFVPSPGAQVAGRYVAEQIWPRIYSNHPELSGFVLVEMESWDEVFRWSITAVPSPRTNEAGKHHASPLRPRPSALGQSGFRLSLNFPRCDADN